MHQLSLDTTLALQGCCTVTINRAHQDSITQLAVKMERVLSSTTLSSATTLDHLKMMQLTMGLRFLKSASLEKRLVGLVEIGSVVVNTSSMKDRIVHWMEKEAVVSVLFGPNKHPELLKRSLTLMEFLVRHEKIGKVEMKLMWKVVLSGKKGMDSSSSQCTLEILIELLPSFSKGVVQELFTCMKTSEKDLWCFADLLIEVCQYACPTLPENVWSWTWSYRQVEEKKYDVDEIEKTSRLS